MEAEKLKQTKATASTSGSLFTDDVILEILCRLPARSLHRFKCVSVAWRHLIADPANRKKLPQTLAGFLYTTTSNATTSPTARSRHHFASVSGDDSAALFDPALPYLPRGEYKDTAQVDACNGLLLCRRYNNNLAPAEKDHCRFVVCNPATGRWVELPPQPQPHSHFNGHNHVAGLAFDRAVSPHFHILCFEQAFLGTRIAGLNIYSSRTGAWSRRDSGMVDKVTVFFMSKCVFVSGIMYVTAILEDAEYVILGVDMEGQVSTTIRVPYGPRLSTIGSSQGCLHYAIHPQDDSNKILVFEVAIWCLKDRCDSKGLVLKHTVSIDNLMSMTGHKYKVVGIHPDCDTIFLRSSGDDTLVSYDTRHQTVGRILNLEKGSAHQFLPYVPLFSETLADADGQ